jgi:hypothetical protein
VKHLQAISLKALHQELICPSLGCMAPYHPGRKFNFDDDMIIVLPTMSKRINFILEDMMKVDAIS